MKTNPKLRLMFLALLSFSSFAHAQSTAFTYHGRLHDNGVPANGPYDLRFTAYDAEVDGGVVAGPLDFSPVDVVNGLFTVRPDFGADVFTGEARWLHIEVRPTGGVDFTTLAPRQEVTSSPYAIRAQTAGNVASGAVTANQLNTGGVAPAPGQFLSYDDGNLFWSEPGVAAGDIFSLNGTAAYYNGGNVGIGISNPQERLTIAGVSAYNTGLRVTGNATSGTGIAIENTSSGGHKYDILSGGASTGIGVGSFGIWDETIGSYRLMISAAGNVGIGTTSPEPGYRLEVNGSTRLVAGGSGGEVRFSGPNGETGMTIVGQNRADIRFDGSTLKLLANAGAGVPPNANGITIDTAGTVGVGKKIDFGAHLGQHLNLWSDPAFSRYFGIGIQDSTFYNRCGGGGADGFAWYKGGIHDSGYHNGGGGQLLMALDGSGMFVAGPASVCTLTIRGGCDLAEPFQMKEQEIEKGSVVVIDDEHPGQLKLSTQACDTRVAGIVSGANGVNTGIALLQKGAFDHGQNVALSGRVYVQADAAFGAIKPGDLLTTSNTPGHAMKVADHATAQGAILGKAMSGLKEGKGMVLVLVTLQ